MLSICLVTDDVHFNYLTKIMSANFLCFKVNICNEVFWKYVNIIFPIKLIISECIYISMDSWCPILCNGLSSATIDSHFDFQIALELARGGNSSWILCLLNIPSSIFEHVLSQQHISSWSYILNSCHLKKSHFSKELLQGKVVFRSQYLGTKGGHGYSGIILQIFSRQ